MRNLLSNKKVQLGLGAAVVALVLWLCVAGGEEQVEEVNTTEVAVEVIAPKTVDAAISEIETTGEADAPTEDNTDGTENTTE